MSRHLEIMVSTWILLSQNFHFSHTDFDTLSNYLIPNRDVVSTEYSKHFHQGRDSFLNSEETLHAFLLGLPLSYNNVAITLNITDVLRTATDTGRSFIIPQDRILFIRVESEPHFYDVMNSVCPFSKNK